jgi:hypothetical protein
VLGGGVSKECGSVFDPLVTSLPVAAADGAFSSAPGRGLAGSGGGIGRVAEGASGISSGFCWATAPPDSHKLIPIISSALVFILIVLPPNRIVITLATKLSLFDP